MGDAFAVVDKMIRESFLSCLFFGKKKTLSPAVGDLITIPVKKSGMRLMNPVTSSQENYLISTRGSKELVRAVTGGGGFSNADHLRTLSEEQCDRKEARDVAYESRLKILVRNLLGNDKPLLLHTKITGAWRSVHGTTVLGTVRSATEFLDFLCACYNLSPINLQSHCDRCGTEFGLTHTLRCSI